MTAVQMTLDDSLLAEVDQAVAELGTTRSAFTRDALRHALIRVRTRQAEQRHREGYATKPVSGDEFAAWEGEQSWGDA